MEYYNHQINCEIRKAMSNYSYATKYKDRRILLYDIVKQNNFLKKINEKIVKKESDNWLDLERNCIITTFDCSSINVNEIPEEIVIHIGAYEIENMDHIVKVRNMFENVLSMHKRLNKLKLTEYKEMNKAYLPCFKVLLTKMDIIELYTSDNSTEINLNSIKLDKITIPSGPKINAPITKEELDDIRNIIDTKVIVDTIDTIKDSNMCITLSNGDKVKLPLSQLTPNINSLSNSARKNLSYLTADMNNLMCKIREMNNKENEESSLANPCLSFIFNIAEHMHM